jgi:1-acyl-sn-glycerol-3-phosphate acyltransferase
MSFFYRFSSTATRVVTYALAARVDLGGIDNLPRSGPVILTPNHLHFADPPVLGGLLPRPIRYMVKQEAWDAPFLRYIVRWYDAFPVRRGEADVGAYRTSLKLLRQGEVVGIFPEGHRSKDGVLQSLHPGAIILATRTGAPIVPLGMSGVREVLGFPGVLRQHVVRVRVGEPYHPEPIKNGDSSEQVAELARRISALLPPRHQQHSPRAPEGPLQVSPAD